MEGVVQCPVCTLFLHPGMNLDEHLNTHPKDQVIQALTQLTLQRANILSPQFVAKSPTPTAIASPPFTQPAPPPPPPPPQQKPSPPAVVTAPETALVIQIPSTSQHQQHQPPQHHQQQQQQHVQVQASPQNLFNKQSISYVQDPQKNIMIVNSCSTQFIQQRIANPQAKRQLEIAYGEQPIQVRDRIFITKKN